MIRIPGRAVRREIVHFNDGLAIRGSFPHDVTPGDIMGWAQGSIGLTIADPPYGNIVDKAWDKIGVSDIEFAKTMLGWTRTIGEFTAPGGALYLWGGIGKPGFRPFYHFMSSVERMVPPWTIGTQITWSKRRAYGIQYGYLFTREECAYLCFGDPKKPRQFKVPLLAELRGYPGYNEKYAAKSEFLRRTNVWTDVTEIFKGKAHINQKPQKLFEIAIEAHTLPGEVVVDPFAGSGTTALAARALGRRWIVIERDEETFQMMVKRIGKNGARC